MSMHFEHSDSTILDFIVPGPTVEQAPCEEPLPRRNSIVDKFITKQGVIITKPDSPIPEAAPKAEEGKVTTPKMLCCFGRPTCRLDNLGRRKFEYINTRAITFDEAHHIRKAALKRMGFFWGISDKYAKQQIEGGNSYEKKRRTKRAIEKWLKEVKDYPAVGVTTEPEIKERMDMIRDLMVKGEWHLEPRDISPAEERALYTERRNWCNSKTGDENIEDVKGVAARPDEKLV